MRKASLLDQKIDALLAGQPVAPSDAVATELAAFRDALGGAFPLPVISEAIEDAHLVRMMDALVTSPAASTLVVRSAVPTPVQRLKARLSTKVAAATFAFTTAFGGAAYAGVLPQPVQDATAKAAAVLGIDLPSSSVDADIEDPDTVADPRPDLDRDRVPVGAEDDAKEDDDPRTDGAEDHKDGTQDQTDDLQTGEGEESEDGAEDDDDDRDGSEDGAEDDDDRDGSEDGAQDDNDDAVDDVRDGSEDGDEDDDDRDGSEDGADSDDNDENDESVDDSVDDARDEEDASDEPDDLEVDDSDGAEEASDLDED